jgi:tetratricopeptide (TPR) repeat protein
MTQDRLIAGAVRDAVNERLLRHEVEEANRIFKENEAGLPEVVRLECLGDLHFSRREYQDAIRCYQEVSKIKPEYSIARFHYLAGVQQERLGNFVDAFKQYQAAIESEPRLVHPYVELGGLLSKVNDYEGARQCYRDAVRLEPEDPANHHNLKTVLVQLMQADPNRYRAELEAAEAEHERVVKSASLGVSANRQW